MSFSSEGSSLQLKFSRFTHLLERLQLEAKTGLITDGWMMKLCVATFVFSSSSYVRGLICMGNAQL